MKMINDSELEGVNGGTGKALGEGSYSDSEYNMHGISVDRSTPFVTYTYNFDNNTTLVITATAADSIVSACLAAGRRKLTDRMARDLLAQC